MARSRAGKIAARNIRKLRTAKGWSCGELGSRIGLTRGGVSAIEVGRVAPTLDVCEACARAFGVSLADLFSPARVVRSAPQLPDHS
jgi:putative transcriptional regulator